MVVTNGLELHVNVLQLKTTFSATWNSIIIITIIVRFSKPQKLKHRLNNY